MTTAAKVNAVLKTVGLANLRYRCDSVLRIDGKTVRAIYATSHSPVDVTNAAAERVRAKHNQIVEELVYEFGGKVTDRDVSYTRIDLGTAEIVITCQRYPSYKYRDNMDPGYVQSAFVVRVNKIPKQ